MTEPDWHFLLDTALMHHAMWANGRRDFAAEVRQRVAAFGATPADRVRLKYEIEVPELYPAGNAGNAPTGDRTPTAAIGGSTATPEPLPRHPTHQERATRVRITPVRHQPPLRRPRRPSRAGMPRRAIAPAAGGPSTR